MDLNQQNETISSNETTTESVGSPMKKLKGFAKLKVENPEAFYQRCSIGGKSAHAKGTGHKFNKESATKASMVAKAKRDAKKQENAA